MAISLAPLQPRKRDRAQSRSGRRRRTVRWLVHVFLLAAALLAFATPALAATQSTQSTQSTHATQKPASAPAPAPVTLTAAVTPALPGGVCQVPGIGDIGGLVGLCASGSSGIVGAVNNICEPSVPAAGAGHRRHQRDDRTSGHGRRREDAVRQLRDRRPVLGRPRPAVLRHDLADRQQRRGHGLRRGQVPGPGDDHRLSVGGGQQHLDLAAELGEPPDQRARQRHLLPLPDARGHPRRDLAGLAGPGPQAGQPHPGGHAVDGGGLRGRDRADRQARGLHRGRDDGVQRRHRGAQHRVLQPARPGQQQLPAGAGGRPAGHLQLRVHLG